MPTRDRRRRYIEEEHALRPGGAGEPAAEPAFPLPPAAERETNRY